MNFIPDAEKKLSKDFEQNGYIIKNIQDLNSLEKLQKIFLKIIKKNVKKTSKQSPDKILNFIHNKIKKNELNNLRLKIINEINKNKDTRKLYYNLAKPYLDILVGNELAMQIRVNLSVQLPGDSSSLLPVHSDVWSGDSPFEIVVWLPLVDCYKTKSMYILPPTKVQKLNKIFLKKGRQSSEKIFKLIKKQVTWLNIKYGQVLLFNQTLPHGNRVNREKETRWSLNCRFKGVFTPYRDKRLGEFFEPITLRKISQLAIKYNLPKIK
jgi:sporadic carbohydrate cluster 2OG-Fe(II) oxygenase